MAKSKGHRISTFREFRLLTRQYSLTLSGNKKEVRAQNLMSILSAVILLCPLERAAFAEIKWTDMLMNLMVFWAVWNGLNLSLGTVVSERSLVIRDLIHGEMRIRCYTASRALLLFRRSVLQVLLLFGVYCGMSYLYEGRRIWTLLQIAVLYGCMLLLFWMTACFGMMISCMLKKKQTASILLPVLLVLEMALSGCYLPLEELLAPVCCISLGFWGKGLLESILYRQIILPLFLIVPAAASMVFLMIGNLAIHRMRP